MTQRLEMADGAILELPDGATPEAMDRAALDYVNSQKPYTGGDLTAPNGRTFAQNDEAAKQSAVAAGTPVGDHPLAQDVPLRILHGGVVAPIQWAAAKLPAGPLCPLSGNGSSEFSLFATLSL